jgi:uncharacterized protein YdaU (DUF1376 family)
MPWYVADFVADTQHLDSSLTGAYMLLIGHYWLRGGLPDDDAALARISRMSPTEWRKARPTIFAFFSDGWRHRRIDDELASAAEISSKRKAAAEQKHSKSSASAEQKHTQPQPQSQTQVDSGGGERANAFEVAAELATICGHPDATNWPPGWCGSPHWVQKCLNEGWLPEIMIAETRAVVGRKRDGPIENYIYLEKPLARAHARHSAPLPKVEIPTQEVISGTNTPAQNRGGSALAAIRQIRRELGGEQNRNDPFGLPKGRLRGPD